MIDRLLVQQERAKEAERKQEKLVRVRWFVVTSGHKEVMVRVRVRVRIAEVSSQGKGQGGTNQP